MLWLRTILGEDERNVGEQFLVQSYEKQSGAILCYLETVDRLPGALPHGGGLPGVSGAHRRAQADARPRAGAWPISGLPGGSLTVNGLLNTGGGLTVGGGLGGLHLRHCTLVPGLTLNVDGTPSQPSAPSLIVQGATLVQIDHCITGGLRAETDVRVQLAGSIIDATAESNLAFAAPANDDPGGALRSVNCTSIGKVSTEVLELASNTIFLAALAGGDPWAAPVLARRRQEGCVRFSYVPTEARVPRRYRCQPATAAGAARVRPVLASSRYGTPAYCQLSGRCAVEIRQGADDEAEMGSFHDLYQPQRESHLRRRLEEYLRFGLEAGVFYAS